MLYFIKVNRKDAIDETFIVNIFHCLLPVYYHIDVYEQTSMSPNWILFFKKCLWYDCS